MRFIWNVPRLVHSICFVLIVAAVLSGIALFELGHTPKTVLGWVLLPFGGAALALLEVLGEVAFERTRRVLTLRGFIVCAALLVLLASAIAVFWEHLARGGS